MFKVSFAWIEQYNDDDHDDDLTAEAFIIFYGSSCKQEKPSEGVCILSLSHARN